MESNRYYYYPQKEIKLEDFETDGFILDIGGGGEAIIAQLKGDQVISVDKRMQELIDAPSTNLKIEMDAESLKFPDESFSFVTSFYTFLYFKSKHNIETVFSEAYRVLKPNGHFLLWDIESETQKENQPDVFVALLSIKFKEKQVNTGYGCKWHDEIHDLSLFKEIAEKTGFIIVNENLSDNHFNLKLLKK